MAFTFIHAADLHIDSPLESLGAKDPEVAARFAAAGRAAVTALIRETIETRRRSFSSSPATSLMATGATSRPDCFSRASSANCFARKFPSI